MKSKLKELAALAKLLLSPAMQDIKHISFGPDLGMKTIQLLAEGACPKLTGFRLDPVEAFIKKNLRLKKMKLNGASFMDNNYEANT